MTPPFRASFRVYGVPRPKGSTVSFCAKSGRMVTKQDSPHLAAWTRAIRMAAGAHAPRQPSANPWRLTVRFWMPRGKMKHHLHTKRPDADKLLRAVGDALGGVFYDDDSRIAEVAAHKIYAPHGEQPGALVTVEELRE